MGTRRDHNKVVRPKNRSKGLTRKQRRVNEHAIHNRGELKAERPRSGRP